MNLKLDCKAASRLLSERQDRELPAAEVARLRLHLVLCSACRNVSEQLDLIRRAMKQLGADERRGDD